MRRPARPGFWLVVRREWRWITRDRAAPILIFAVPLLAFIILSAVFSQQVIRGLGVVVVDNDRSQTSSIFIEALAAAPGLSIVRRSDDLSAAASTIRSGDAIAAVYIPPDFERDLTAARRPQVVAFYNQELLTAAGLWDVGLKMCELAGLVRHKKIPLIGVVLGAFGVPLKAVGLVRFDVAAGDCPTMPYPESPVRFGKAPVRAALDRTVVFVGICWRRRKSS